ncbi:hypothetical protein EDD11_002014 [Mortierella claussenii]|nr:hypothetical protein EDD11_002014 [Mortierella claussenii]
MAKLWQSVQLGDQTYEVQARAGTAQTEGEPFVLLQDVGEVFPGAARLQLGKRVLGFMVDHEGNRLQPLRVPYMPDHALEVVLGTGSTLTQPQTLPPYQLQLEGAYGYNDILEQMPVPPRHSDKSRRPATQNSGSRRSSLGSRSPHSPQLPQAVEYAPDPSLLQQRLQDMVEEQEVLEQEEFYHARELQLQLAQDPQVQMELARRRRLQQSLELPTYSQNLPFRPHEHLSVYSQLEESISIPGLVAVDLPDSISASSDEELKYQFRKSVHLYQTFLEHLHAGRVEQANLIDMDFRRHFETLRPAMTKHHDLQVRVVDMQQNIQQIQRQSAERLVQIKRDVHEILTKSVEMHEYASPRLFIVLPRDPSGRDGASLTESQFRLYFLCECGEHTMHASFCKGTPINSNNGSTNNGNTSKVHGGDQSFTLSSSMIGSSTNSIVGSHVRNNSTSTINSVGGSVNGGQWSPHHLHLAKHEGYDLNRPVEFFRQYGSYALRLLQMLKYGISMDGFTVPTQLSLQNGEPSTKRTKNTIESHLESAVNQAIEFLNSRLMLDHPSSLTGQSRSSMALSDKDAKQLQTFLEITEKSGVLGNLYRVSTMEGCARWVCRDHYRESYNTSAIKDLHILTAIDGGSFNEHFGRIEISLSTGADAAQFYRALERARSVQELSLTLAWDISLSDAKALRDTIYRSNVALLNLRCAASTSPAEMLSRNKRAEPLWNILTSPRLRSFSLDGYSGFFRRITTTDGRRGSLRMIRIADKIEWDKDACRIIDLLKLAPRLTDLTLVSNNIYETYQLVRDAALRRSTALARLAIETSKDERLTAHLEHGQVLDRMEVTIPTLPPYSRLFENIGCISSIHLSSKITFQRDSRTILELLRQNENLSELKISCQVSDFVSFYETIRQAILKKSQQTGWARFQKLCLYIGDNQFHTHNILDPNGLSLELLQTKDINKGSLLNLIEAYGSRLVKLRIDGPSWKAAHSALLLDSITRASISAAETTVFSSSPRTISEGAKEDVTAGSKLTHLYQNILDTDESMLEDLALVINHSGQLQEYNINVDQPFKSNALRSMQWIEFMKAVGDKMTNMTVSCLDSRDWIKAFGNTTFKALENVTFEQPPSKMKLTNPNHATALWFDNGIYGLPNPVFQR